MSEPFVPVETVADFLGVARDTVLALARRGELPAHPLSTGRQRITWRFRMSEIEQHITSQSHR